MKDNCLVIIPVIYKDYIKILILYKKHTEKIEIEIETRTQDASLNIYLLFFALLCIFTFFNPTWLTKYQNKLLFNKNIILNRDPVPYLLLLKKNYIYIYIYKVIDISIYFLKVFERVRVCSSALTTVIT